jgi:hypothetical protein
MVSTLTSGTFKMAGIAGHKFTLEELKQLSAYALEAAVDPGIIETREEAKSFNDVEKKVAKSLGIQPHVWTVGEKYYLLAVGLKKKQIAKKPLHKK